MQILHPLLVHYPAFQFINNIIYLFRLLHLKLRIGPSKFYSAEEKGMNLGRTGTPMTVWLKNSATPIQKFLSIVYRYIHTQGMERKEISACHRMGEERAYLQNVGIQDL